MKRFWIVFYAVIVISATSLYAEAVDSTSLNLSGVVAPKSLLGVTQLLGAAPGTGNAIPLDSGDILFDAEGDGIEVGTWSASSNSSATLELIIDYTPFTDSSLVGVSIPYIVYNGSDWIAAGDPFHPLIKVGGTYRSEDNSGSVFIKRTDTNTYPPSFNYQTTISFTLQAQ